MPDDIPEIGQAHFSQARRTERARASASRRSAAQAALAALHAARDAFADQASEIYSGGAEAALRDSDQLEEIADRLVGAIEGLQPALERLDIARDLVVHRGSTLHRARSRYDLARLASLAGEALAEDLLCGGAGAVLAAAVRRRAGR